MKALRLATPTHEHVFGKRANNVVIAEWTTFKVLIRFPHWPEQLRVFAYDDDPTPMEAQACTSSHTFLVGRRPMTYSLLSHYGYLESLAASSE